MIRARVILHHGAQRETELGEHMIPANPADDCIRIEGGSYLVERWERDTIGGRTAVIVRGQRKAG